MLLNYQDNRSIPFNTFAETETYLQSFIFPRENYEYLRLERIKLFLKLLDNPHRKFKSIHVGGTAGKGSTCFIIASIIETAGYKVGLTISPHLQKLTERIQLNRRPIPDSEFIAYVNRLKPIIEAVNAQGKFGYPSYFEIIVALSFLYFAEQKVDIAVIEVGLGGKLDATNVLFPEVSVITNIGFDHMEWLGDTLSQIAAEKAGIIKRRSVVVTGATQPKVLTMIREKAKQKNAKLLIINKDFRIIEQAQTFDYLSPDFKIDNLSLSLPGRFQHQNAALAITAVKSLRRFTIPLETIRKSLQTIFFAGRIEIASVKDKKYIIDGAHNVMKIKALVAALKELFPLQKFSILLAIKRDKQYRKMIDLLVPIAESFVITEFGKITDTGKKLSQRTEKIGKYFRTKYPKMKVTAIADSAQALAFVQTQPVNEILITGSLYLVGEVRDLLKLK